MSDLKGILFLTGVFKKDFLNMEELFEKRLISDDDNQIETIKYDKLPSLFTGIETWPTKCNLLCNYCTCDIDETPWFEPQSLETKDIGLVGSMDTNGLNNTRYTCISRGAFCSENCVAAFIESDKTPISEKINKQGMLKLLYKIFKNAEIDEIKPSPSPLVMKKFGGDTSEFNYRSIISDLSNGEDIISS